MSADRLADADVLLVAGCDAGIAETARLALGDLRQASHALVAGLAGAVRALPAPAWAAPVLTAHSRPVPASEVPWMRRREVGMDWTWNPA